MNCYKTSTTYVLASNYGHGVIVDIEIGGSGGTSKTSNNRLFCVRDAF